MDETSNIKSGEYSERGDYHKNLDPNWSYYPIYIRKLQMVDDFIGKHVEIDEKILDLGCGEGVLVEKYSKKKYSIIGVDANYSSNLVLQKDLFQTGFGDGVFGAVLLLDVIEHLEYPLQKKALNEISRLLRAGGKVCISIPNLAHKQSRWKFFLEGRLVRTANPNKHVGDRPIKEYIDMILECGFEIVERLPIKLTLPPFQEKILKLFLGKKGAEKYVYSLKRNPDDCFLNMLILKKP